MLDWVMEHSALFLLSHEQVNKAGVYLHMHASAKDWQKLHFRLNVFTTLLHLLLFWYSEHVAKPDIHFQFPCCVTFRLTLKWFVPDSHN